MTSRDALNELENDSIFLLLRGPRAVESLDIVPKNYGNSSRFVAGLNNSVKRAVRTKLENIKSLRLSYKGRVRLLLHTIKPIQAGETLYFDYNGSPFQEYPTDHFVPWCILWQYPCYTECKYQQQWGGSSNNVELHKDMNSKHITPATFQFYNIIDYRMGVTMSWKN